MLQQTHNLVLTSCCCDTRLPRLGPSVEEASSWAAFAWGRPAHRSLATGKSLPPAHLRLMCRDLASHVQQDACPPTKLAMLQIRKHAEYLMAPSTSCGCSDLDMSSSAFSSQARPPTDCLRQMLDHIHKQWLPQLQTLGLPYAQTEFCDLRYRLSNLGQRTSSPSETATQFELAC